MKKRNSFSSACIQKGGQEVFVRYITNDLLKKVTGTICFEHVSSLNLTLVPEAGKIKYIENLDRFHQLQKLNLSKNCIEKIDNISYLVNLRELDLSHNCLTKIDGLQSLTNIHVLNFSYNKIKHVPKWLPEKLQQLRIFKIEQNRLEDMNDFLWFRGLANFVSLNVLENSFTQMSHYKFYLLFHLPCLEKLDDMEVTLDLRLEAKQMFGQAEIDRLANLVHEKETECLRLENSLKKSIRNSENEEKLKSILEIKSKEFQIKTGEYDKKLEATNEILKKKTKNVLDANLKHIELEHNLAFYKIDHKFDCFTHDSKESISSIEVSMDSSSTFGESPYYGKAFFKQNLTSLPNSLAQNPFMSCDWPNCSDCTIPSQNELVNINYWLHPENNCDMNENDEVPPKMDLEQQEINPSEYSENKNLHLQKDRMDTVKNADFDKEYFDVDTLEILDRIRTTAEELRSIIVLQSPNILAAIDKVKTLKRLFQVLVKEDQRDVACSPIQMNFSEQKHSLTSENSGVCNDFDNAINKVLRYQQIKYKNDFKGVSDAWEPQISNSKEPNENGTYDRRAQSRTTCGLKTLNTENTENFDKNEMPSLKSPDNGCDAFAKKEKDCTFYQCIHGTSDEKPIKTNHIPGHLENFGWFCNIPYHIYQDHHFLKEFVEKIFSRLFNKNRRKDGILNHYAEIDCRVLVRLFQKLWLRKKAIDALDLAIDNQETEIHYLETLTKCLWIKTNNIIKDIKQFMLSKDIQTEFGFKTKLEEFLKLNNEKRSELQNIKYEDRIDVSFSEIDSEIICKQEKLSDTLNLITEHEAIDLELTKKIQRNLMTLQDVQKRLFNIETKEKLLNRSYEMQKEFLNELQRDLLSVENLVKSLNSVLKKIHKELFSKMKQHCIISDEISKKVNEYILINNSIDIRNHSMKTLEELCISLQNKSDALYREIIKRSESDQHFPNTVSPSSHFETVNQNDVDDARLLKIKKNDVSSQSDCLWEKKSNGIVLKHVKFIFETLFVKLHRTNMIISSIVTRKNVIVCHLGQLKVDLKEEQFQLINIQTKIRKYNYSYQSAKQMKNTQFKMEHIVGGVRNIRKNLARVKKDCRSVTMKRKLCKAYLALVNKDMDRNKNLIKEIKKKQQDIEEQIVSKRGIKDTIVKENTFNLIASVEKIVVDNNNNKERLIAELIEEKLLLKEENKKLIQKLKLSYAEILHLKIDFCDKIKNMVEIKLKLEEKLQMTTKVVKILNHEYENLGVQASPLKSNYSNGNNQNR